MRVQDKVLYLHVQEIEISIYAAKTSLQNILLDEDQILESTVYADSEYEISDNQTCREHEDLFDYVGAHVPTVVSLNETQYIIVHVYCHKYYHMIQEEREIKRGI